MAKGWLSARAIRLHVALVIVVPGCIVAGLWQLDRALSGNTLSWVYTFEWPFFAGYGVYVWRKLMREILAEAKEGGKEAPGSEAQPAGAKARQTGVGDVARETGVGDGATAREGAGAAGAAVGGAAEAGQEAGYGHEDATGQGGGYGQEGADGQEEEEDEELAAYNRYLAELNASGRQKRW